MVYLKNAQERMALILVKRFSDVFRGLQKGTLKDNESVSSITINDALITIFTIFSFIHCVKRVRFCSFSGRYFTAFKQNTELYFVKLRIQSEFG